MSSEANTPQKFPAKRAAAKAAPAPKTASKAQSYDIAQSAETLDLAKDLAQFIKANKLTTQVQGKEFVNVEGWQYAGSRLGIVPIVEHSINVSNEQEIKYQAKVTLFDLRHQVTVGAGFAVCSNKESGKKFYQEFAIMSMAQTRATGKAFRNVLAWIIRAAGYEPTPAEEMDYNTQAVNPTTGNGGDSSSARPAASATSVPSNARPIPAITNGPINPPANPPEMRVVGTDEATTPVVAVQYATASQKEDIIRLLNHPTITRPEKTKMLININRLDEERAMQAIAKLRRAIDERENGEEMPGLREELRSLAEDNAVRLGKPEVDRLFTLADRNDINAEVLRDNIKCVREELASTPAA